MKMLLILVSALTGIILSGTVVSGDLAAALEEKNPSDRLAVLVSILENHTPVSKSLLRSLAGELQEQYGEDKTLDSKVWNRMKQVLQKKPEDTLCAEVILSWASQAKESPEVIEKLTEKILRNTKLADADDEKTAAFYRILDFYTSALVKSGKISAVVEIYDYLINKYPFVPGVACQAAEFYALECFRSTDTAPGLPGYEQLADDNIWKNRLTAIEKSSPDMVVANAFDAASYSLLAVVLHNTELFRKTVEIYRQVPVLKTDDKMALPILAIRMKMPEFCRNVDADILPLFLASAGDLKAAEKALTNVSKVFYHDMLLSVMMHKGDFEGIKNLFIEKKCHPVLSHGINAGCTAAIKLRNAKLLDAVIAQLPQDRKKWSASICNIIGYSSAELNCYLTESEKLIRRALEEDPESAHFLDSLAWVLFKQKKFQKARHFMGEALKRREAESETAVLFLHAAAIEFATTGDKAAARNYLKRAEKLYVPDVFSEYDTEYARKLKEQLE